MVCKCHTVQSAVNPRRVRFSSYTLTPALLSASSQPPCRGGGAQQRSSTAVIPPGPSLPRLPHPGVVDKPAGLVGDQLLHSNVSPRPHTSLGPPTWASVARGDANVRVEKTTCTQPPPAVTAAEFLALFHHCMASGLKARMVTSHAAGCQAITVTCNLPASTETTTTAGGRHRRRRHRRWRGRAATAARAVPAQLSSPVAAAPMGGDISSPSVTPPPPSLPKLQPPPAKRTRKRQNEVELLRDSEVETDLLLSPLSCPATPPSNASPPPPAPTTPSPASPLSTPPASMEAVPDSPPPVTPEPPTLPANPLPALTANHVIAFSYAYGPCTLRKDTCTIAAIPTYRAAYVTLRSTGIACASIFSDATATHPISARLASLQKMLQKLPRPDVLPLLVLQQRKPMKSPRKQATKIQYECRVKGRMNVA
jgi:hypothetical protein